MTLTGISAYSLFVFNHSLSRTYKKVVNEGIERTSSNKKDIIKEEDISYLPDLLQEYLRQAGVIGQERVHNVKILFKGRMRSNPNDPWLYFTSEQYNFFDQPTRAFYIKSRKMGLPVNGLHLYKDEKAFMKIKLAGLISIIDVNGPEMDKSETVTFLNDICFFAPAVLVNLKNIQWTEIDHNRLQAIYKNGSQTIKAELVFNEEGRLINFISHDRYEIIGKQSHQRPWFTPITEYSKFGKNTLPNKAGAWYERPDGDFCYGEFETIDVMYNCDE